MKRAFTLVEILISLAIISVMLGLGIYAMTYFQKVMLVDQASSDFLSLVTETKNYAKNNSVSQKISAKDMIDKSYGYKLTFSGNTITRSLCSKQPKDTWDKATCPPEYTVNIKAESYSAVKIDLPNPLPAGQCDSVVFENLTEKIVFMYGNTIVNPATSTCSIKITHNDTPSITKTLTFNSSNGKYAIE